MVGHLSLMRAASLQEFCSINDVAEEHIPGDIVLGVPMCNADGKWSKHTVRVEVKAHSYGFPKSVVIEHVLLRDIDDWTGLVYPEEKGWFEKRGADYYAFVYVDTEGVPQHALIVKESELWEYMQKYQHKYHKREMRKAMCSVVSYYDIRKHCPSTREIYSGSAIKLTLERQPNDEYPSGITKVEIGIV